MPGVQCVICLSSDTSSEEWCMLKECGHVFHVHCVAQSLEHSRRCPQCRTEYSRRKFSAANPPYQRIFFEFSDEPASQSMPSGSNDGGGGGGSSAASNLQQISFLQGQLRNKDRHIQTTSMQLAEQEERAQRLEHELGLARAGMREKEAKVQEKILELSRERKQVKGLANQVANLMAQLKGEAARASLLLLAADQSLAGGALAAEVEKLVRLGLKGPHNFWEKLMSERSQVIIANSNKHSREKAALEWRQQQLQGELSQVQEQVTTLKRSLAAAQHQQPIGAAAAAAKPLPEPQAHGATSASRHAVRRFDSLGGPAAAAAAGEEDPLVHTYDLLNMRQAELAAATTSRRDHCLGQLQQRQTAAQAVAAQSPARAGIFAAAAVAAAVAAAEEVVVLDGSEEQLEDGGCFGEIEFGTKEEQQMAAPAAPQQQKQGVPSRLQQQQQHQQQSHAAAASMLGKRPFYEVGSSFAFNSQVGMPDENCVSGSRSAPLLAAAGPGRLAMQQAPGKSFIRNAAAASVGIDRGKYISSGPDGKGGVATAYQGGGGGAPVRLSQRQIDVRALQNAGGSKKARPSSGGSKTDTAAAMALRRNNALPITRFFTRS